MLCNVDSNSECLIKICIAWLLPLVVVAFSCSALAVTARDLFTLPTLPESGDETGYANDVPLHPVGRVDLLLSPAALSASNETREFRSSTFNFALTWTVYSCSSIAVFTSILRAAVSPSFGANESGLGFAAIVLFDVIAKGLMLLLTDAAFGKVPAQSGSMSHLLNCGIAFMVASFWDFSHFEHEGYFTMVFPLLNLLTSTLTASAAGYVWFKLPSSSEPVSGGSYYRLGSDWNNYWPEYTSGIFSRVSFSWMNDLIDTAVSRPLVLSDLWELDAEDTGRILYDKLAAKMNLTSYCKGTLLPLLMRLNWKILAFEYSISLIDHLFIFGGPFFIRHILQAIQDPKSTPSDILKPVCGMLIAALARTTCESQLYWVNRRIDVRLRSAIVGAIYMKGLQRMQPPLDLSGTARKEGISSDGAVSNLMSADTDKILACFRQSHYVLSVPFLLLLCSSLLVSTVGWVGAIAGMASLSLAVPATRHVGKLIKSHRKDLMKKSDTRLAKLQEILSGIRSIKLFAWEPHFLETSMNTRASELDSLKSYLASNMATQLIWRCSPLLASAVTFIVRAAVSRGEAIDAATAFTVLALYNNVLRYPLFVIPKLAISAMELNVSIDRIESFLMEPGLERFSSSFGAQGNSLSEESEFGFRDNASFDFGGMTRSVVIKNLNFSFPRSKLTMIVGQSGSGKSSLLLALLGELRTLSGKVVTPANQQIREDYPISYVSQSPWLLNTTIKENILFGAPFNELRYQQVLDACALKPDLASFESGDMTNVGDKGATVSGGQRQRISLARAVYANSRVILMDDVLSAVDAKTARHILQECLLGSLMSGRTQVLVTHAVELVMPAADALLVMGAEGVMLGAGSVDEVLAKAEVDSALKRALDTAMGGDSSLSRGKSTEFRTGDVKVKVEESEAPAATLKVKAPKEESKLTGQVSWDAYKFYLMSAGGLGSGFLFLGSIAIAYGAGFLHDYSLKVWSDQTDANHSFSALMRYGMAAAIAIFALFIRFSYQIYFSAKASNHIYAHTFSRLLHAPLSVFDSTTSGAILNRFGKDTQVLDQEVASSVGETLQQLLHGLAVVFMIVTASPLLIVFAVPIGILYVPIARRFLAATRSLKRLESSSRSPVYTAFGEMLAGAVTIRAFGRSQTHLSAALNTLDANHRAFLPLWGVNRWLAFRVEAVGALVAFAAGSSVAFAVTRGAGQTGGIDPGWAGLVLNYAGMFTDVLTWLVRNSAQMEMTFTSVERLQEYVSLDQEPDTDEGRRPPDGWPSEGSVIVRDLGVRYKPDAPLALDLSGDLVFKPGQRVAVVGRTGSGKSTFGMSFVRLAEFERGSIILDGIDIAMIGVHDLRDRVIIIPQEPFLFSGTVQTNLDPTNAHPLPLLQASIQIASPAATYDADVPLSLETRVAEGGSNLSAGHRQRISLARAALRKRARDAMGVWGRTGGGLIVLDEATASMDARGDAAAQATLRALVAGEGLEGAVEWTCVVIAHRLQGILDLDRVLVLSSGSVVQDGVPMDLLRQGAGAFWELCRDAGINMDRRD